MTNTIPLQPGVWTLIYSGPTSSQIHVERSHRCAAVWIAASDSNPPAFERNGHLMNSGVVKIVELEEGENLYAWLSETTPDSSNSIIITD